MAIGDLEDRSSRCVRPLSYHSSSAGDPQMLPSEAESRLRFPQSNQEQYSLNRYLPSSVHQHQLKESASTSRSLELPGTSQLATTHPSFATVRPATGDHPEFRDVETDAPSAFEGVATGGLLQCEDETDGAVGAAASSSEKNELLKTKPALEVIEMGFPSEVVETVIHLKVVETGDDYMTAEALLDAVIAYQIAMNDEDSQTNEESNDRNSPSHNRQLDNGHQQNLSTSDTTQQGDRVLRKKKKGKVKSPRNGMISATGNQHQMNNESARLHTDGKNVEENASVPSQMLSPFSLKEENKKMKSSRLCKICLENEIRIVFLPCGHLVCCSECSSLVQNCTICHRAVKGSVKVFLA